MLFDAVRRKLAAHPRRRPASPAISCGQRATPLTQQTQAVASSGPGLHRFTDAASMRRHWKSTEECMGQLNSEDFLSSEISSYEDLLAKSLQLQDRVKETTASLEAAYSGVINAKHVFEEIKKENIEELRVFRQTVTREAAEIAQAIKQLKSTLDPKSQSELREYVALCERLKALQDAGFKFPA